MVANTPVSEKTPVPSVQKHKSGRALGFFSVFMALATLLIALFLLQNLNEMQQSLKEEKANVRQNLSGINTQLSSVQTQILKSEEDGEKAAKIFDEKIATLNKQLNTIQQETQAQSSHWLVNRARHYLDLAAIHSRYGDNASTTTALLQHADNLLRELNAPNLIATRQAIAEEIKVLQTLPQVDILQILTQLDRAQEAVNDLSLPTFTSTALPAPAARTWRAYWEQSLATLKKAVIIEHHDAAFNPIISTLQQRVVAESIRINLQEAQWAVLRNNAAVYTMALDQAIHNIARTFDKRRENTAALIQSLEQLKDIHLNPAQPEIHKALDLLNQATESKKEPT